MFKNFDIDLLGAALLIGVPTFFAVLSFLGTRSLGISLIVLALGLVAMASLFGHENPRFRIAGGTIGGALGIGLSTYYSTDIVIILGAGLLGCLLGYILARWGYWLLEAISHFN